MNTEPQHSPLHTQVSLYPVYTSHAPATVSLWPVLTTPRYQAVVENLRTLEGEEQETAKKRLPAFTIGGTFNGSHLAENRLSSTNLIGIDLDFKDNQHVAGFANLKASCSQVPFVAYCGLSCRGKGFFIIMLLAYPEQFLKQFKALQQEFERFGLTIDDKCSNPNRLRFVSYDPAPYVNHNAIPFTGLFQEPKRLKLKGYDTSKYNEDSNTAAQVELLVNDLISRGIDITCNYGDWLTIGFALSSEFGESGRQYFHDVSTIYPNYQYGEADKQYTSCLHSKGSGISIGSFFHICKSAGVELPKRKEKADLPKALAEKLSLSGKPNQPLNERELNGVALLIENIISTPCETVTPAVFGGLRMLYVKTQNGSFDLLLGPDGEPVTEKTTQIKELEQYFNKQFQQAKIEGQECLAHIIK